MFSATIAIVNVKWNVDTSGLWTLFVCFGVFLFAVSITKFNKNAFTKKCYPELFSDLQLSLRQAHYWLISCKVHGSDVEKYRCRYGFLETRNII